MKMISKYLVIALTVGALFLCTPANASTLVAEYTFNNTLASNVAGAPDLVATDPLGLNSFGVATVFGNSHSVYNFVGSTASPALQAGLTLDTTGLATGDNYSIRLVASLSSLGGWRRLIDVDNRTSDNGLYVRPDNQLTIFGAVGAGGTLVTGEFADIVITVAPGFVLNAYVNGLLAFTTDSLAMDFTIDNPGNLVNFFLDNLAGTGLNEYSSGSVAEIRLYRGALSSEEVEILHESPVSTVPDAGHSSVLLSIGLSFMLVSRFRIRQSIP